MREVLERMSRPVTLEDLIISRAQKPNTELLNGVARARDVIDEFNLNHILGIRGVDSILFHVFIAERVIKTKIYDFDWVTHYPGFTFTPQNIVRNDFKRDILQESLDRLVLKREEIRSESYIDLEAKLEARKLERAANDLIARATSFDEESCSNLIIVSDELVDSWSMKWKKEFKPKRNKAKQKHLYYKK